MQGTVGIPLSQPKIVKPNKLLNLQVGPRSCGGALANYILVRTWELFLLFYYKLTGYKST